MHYSVLRLCDVRMAVVLVGVRQLRDEKLLAQLQARLALPVMLVARDDGGWKGVKAWAQFDPTQYLPSLLALEDIEWFELQGPLEPELPF